MNTLRDCISYTFNSSHSRVRSRKGPSCPYNILLSICVKEKLISGHQNNIIYTVSQCTLCILSKKAGVHKKWSFYFSWHILEIYMALCFIVFYMKLPDRQCINIYWFVLASTMTSVYRSGKLLTTTIMWPSSYHHVFQPHLLVTLSKCDRLEWVWVPVAWVLRLVTC